MSTKKLLVVAIAVLMTAGVAAQTTNNNEHKAKKTPTERAELQTQHMTKTLNLNEDQQKKVQQINLQYANKMAVVRQNARTQAKSLMDDKKVAMKQVLTNEQFEKYEQNQEKAKARMENHKAGNKGNHKTNKNE